MAPQRPGPEAVTSRGDYAGHVHAPPDRQSKPPFRRLRTAAVLVWSVALALVLVTGITHHILRTLPERMDGVLIALCNDRLISERNGDWLERLMQWYLLLFVFKTRCEEDIDDTPASDGHGRKQPSPLEAVRVYRYARGHVGIQEAQTDVRWWHSCVLNLRGVSIYSDPGTFVRIQKGQHRGIEFDAVFDHEQNSGKCFDDFSSPPSLPVVEIDEMTVGWRSWHEPVLDIRLDGLSVNILFDLTKSKKEGNNPFFLPFSFRNNSLTALINKLPPPPTEEGVYPKFGILDFSNVSVSLLAKDDPSPGPFKASSILQSLSNSKASSNHPELEKRVTETLQEGNADRNTERIYDDVDTCEATNDISTIAMMDVPNKLFDSLRVDTQAAGQGGIEQMHVQSVIEKALMQGLRQHVLGEEYVRSAISKALRDVDSFREYAIGQVKKYGVSWSLFDFSLLADVREAWMQGWEQLQEDWTALTSKTMK